LEKGRIAMNENSLKSFFRSRTTKAGQRRWGCLDEAQIAAYADHQITGREKERVEAHLADCDTCLEQVSFLIRTKNAEMAESVPGGLLLRAKKLAGTKAKSEGSMVWVWGKFAAATAVACLFVATAISLRQSQSPTNPAVAPHQNPVTQPVQSPAPVAPTVPVGRHPAVRGRENSLFIPTVVFSPAGSAPPANRIDFRWQAVPGALDYEVIVLSAVGDQVWKQRATATSVQLPGSVSLEAGRKYFVTVRAYLTEGKSVESAPVGFTVGHH
jgi:Putative zinc-finger